MAPASLKTGAEADAFPCSLEIRIPFPTNRLAHTALRALSVDPELSPLVRRSFSLAAEHATEASQPQAFPTLTNHSLNGVAANTASEKDNEQYTVLVTHYSATTNRMLRVAVNGFFESIGVVIACMRELDVDVVEEDWIGDGDEEVDELRKVQGLQETGTIGQPGNVPGTGM